MGGAWAVTAGVLVCHDGVGEVFVPSASRGACPWDILHDVYVMRGACGHWVGTTVGELHRETALTAFRPHEGFTTDCYASWSRLERGAAPINHERTPRDVFNGTRLRKRSDREQTFPCHHGGIERCEAAGPRR